MAQPHLEDRQQDQGEWIEEEHLVLVELTGVLDSHNFSKSAKECNILGIGTDKPVLQIGNYVFKGEYQNTVGTAVFFEEDGESKHWKYMCSTDKKLDMKRVFLKPHESPDKPVSQEAPTPMDAAEVTPQTDT